STSTLKVAGQATITGNTAGAANGGGGVYSAETTHSVTLAPGSVTGNTPDQCVGNPDPSCIA
ncbi:MAG: hypothetical protein ACR2J8_04140, partial [Thermomicrobiales bacterium]